MTHERIKTKKDRFKRQQEMQKVELTALQKLQRVNQAKINNIK